MMNFYPDSVDSKAYVGSLVSEYQQKFHDEFSNKKRSAEECFDPLSAIGTCATSPSAVTELKRGDTSLDDLDTNADTNSVPDTDFVSEFFDIYNSNDSLEKIYSSLGLKPKWEETSDFKQDLLKQVDTTTTTTTCSESAFKITSFPSSELFFEDEFRYVTSKPVKNEKTYNAQSFMTDRSDQTNATQNLTNSFSLDVKVSEATTSQLDKASSSNSNIFQSDESKKETLLDKAVKDFGSIDQPKVKTEHTNSAIHDVSLVDKPHSNMSNTNTFEPNLTNHNLFVNNKTVPNFESHHIGLYDFMTPQLFFNGPVYNMGAILDHDFYFSPNLYNRYYCGVPRYPVSTNYCVYRGADYNKLVCSCNMNRANGSNSHLTNCNVVAGGVELSTESWPISKASQMYALINTWDRVMKKYKKCTTTHVDFNTFYLPDDCNHQLVITQNEDDKMHNASVGSVNFDHFKSANYLISEITGIKLNIEPPDQFSLSNVVSENFKTEDMAKRRKTNKHKSKDAHPQASFATELDLSTLSPTTEDDGKSDKKDPNQPNGEKVSGVWYDTNRHLWRVVYMKGNKRRTQGFSSLKLGYEEARRKAIQMRYEMVSMKHADRL